MDESTTSLRNIRLTIEFDGSQYFGWQIQAGNPTIQAELEDKLRILTKENVKVRGSSRTDSGVHAMAHVSNFKTTATIPAHGFKMALNNMLSPAISVSDAMEVPLEFDAKRDSVAKIYRYQIWNSPVRSALRSRFFWHVSKPLDVEKMRAGATHLIGENDFSAFRAAECDSKSPFRRLDWIEIASERDEISIRIQANAFLRNMVRIIVGTLVDVGLSRFSPDDVARILASRDRTCAGRTAPPHGLILEKVFYPPLNAANMTA
jgi:tRNA pseudouridine38-40 synthase